MVMLSTSNEPGTGRNRAHHNIGIREQGSGIREKEEKSEYRKKEERSFVPVEGIGTQDDNADCWHTL
jgi:hypothetical protein